MNTFYTSPELFLNLSNPHPLIERNNNYNLSRKLLSIHANDRDKHYYPNSNNFTIKCPQSYSNVQSIRLTEISFPNKIYNFSNNLNNNKFDVSCNSIARTITINDGFYTEAQLAKAMTRKMNKHYQADCSFLVDYYSTEQKFKIISNQSFQIASAYSLASGEPSSNCNNNINSNYRYKGPVENLSATPYPLVFDFLYCIGIDNNIKEYSTAIIAEDIEIECHNYHGIYDDCHLVKNFHVVSYAHIESKNCVRFRSSEPIYLEIDKLNTYDELNPFPKASNNLYNNFSNTSINSAFFKINSENLDTTHFTNNYINDSVLKFFDTPLQKLQNLNIKFRYHDGTLVDLNDQDVNFTLEINELHNEIPRNMNIRTPAI
tara:strand:- start:1437 stop:2558 length:1122 start_codon:yes stop_codon:yes gene_type:complete